MRFLPERRHAGSQSAGGQEAEPIRQRYPAGALRRALPLLPPHAHAARHQALRAGEKSMSAISRREFLQGAGVLIVYCSSASVLEPLAFAQGPFDTHQSHVDPRQLDSWIAIAADGTVTAHTGKCE